MENNRILDIKGIVVDVEGKTFKAMDIEHGYKYTFDICLLPEVQLADIIQWKVKIDDSGEIDMNNNSYDFIVITDDIPMDEKKRIYRCEGHHVIGEQIQKSITSGNKPYRWILNINEPCTEKELQTIGEKVMGDGWSRKPHGKEPVHWNVYQDFEPIIDAMEDKHFRSLYTILVLKGSEDSYERTLIEGYREELNDIEKHMTVLNMIDFEQFDVALFSYVKLLKEYESCSKMTKNTTNSHYRFQLENEVIELLFMYKGREFIELDTREARRELFWEVYELLGS